MNSTRHPFFLLGAGFGADAGPIVGPIDAESLYIGKYRFSCSYPLVRDLPRVCFPKVMPPVSVDEVERRLGEAIAAGDSTPVKLLCEELAKADHYLAPPLVGWPSKPNSYSKFFDRFPTSSFATYNYDAFVEFALFRAGRWSPHDGFGVKVATQLGYTPEPYQPKNSTSLVLHLHGTSLVYSYDFTFGPPDKNGTQWMEMLDTPRFAFDPQTLGSGFFPYERFMAGLAYNPDVQSRVIAPIPDKATGLRGEFVTAAAQRAKQIIQQVGNLVAIGYSFSPHDRASYTALFDTLNDSPNPRAVVVSPDAQATVERLARVYRKIEWIPEALGFANWVEAGYPGVLEQPGR